MWPFEAFLVVHITTGAVGLILFWIPTIGKKGSPSHRKFGMLFSRLMMVTASMAIGMASTTLLAPLETHPKQVALNWPQSRIEGIFGWMMLYLAILTIQLVWHGVVTIRNKKNHLANRHWGNVALNVFTIFAALVCAYRGWLIDEGLMMAFSIVGVASGLTNLWFIYTDEPRSSTSRRSWEAVFRSTPPSWPSASCGSARGRPSTRACGPSRSWWGWSSSSTIRHASASPSCATVRCPPVRRPET